MFIVSLSLVLTYSFHPFQWLSDWVQTQQLQAWQTQLESFHTLPDTSVHSPDPVDATLVDWWSTLTKEEDWVSTYLIEEEVEVVLVSGTLSTWWEETTEHWPFAWLEPTLPASAIGMYDKQLSTVVLEVQDPPSLDAVFWHELGHVVLSQVPESQWDVWLTHWESERVQTFNWLEDLYYHQSPEEGFAELLARLMQGDLEADTPLRQALKAWAEQNGWIF